MPRISTFMYCEQAGIDQNTQKLNITGPLHVLTPPFVPSMFSFTIVFGLIGFNEDETSTLNLRFVNPDGEILVNTGDIGIAAEKNDGVPLPPEAQGFIANMDFRNVVMQKEGFYSTQIYINGDLMGEYPIQVLDGRRGMK